MFRNLFAVIGFVVVAKHVFAFSQKCYRYAVQEEVERQVAIHKAASHQAPPQA